MIENFISQLIVGKIMNISVEITGNLLEYLDKKVKEGLYKSRSEVVREAIRRMIQEDLKEQLEARGINPENLDELRDEVTAEVLEKRYRRLA